MTEEQLQFAEKIRGFLSNLRGSGFIISGQTEFIRVRVNTMNPDGDMKVIVTNRDGVYLFDMCEENTADLPPMRTISGNRSQPEPRTHRLST